MDRKYDFAGWVTKNDILCSDGVTIKKDAFKHNDGEKVPLVWNHDYNSPSNILGHVMLEHKDLGVYGYGYFNNSEQANHAKEMIKHGDISSMSIGAKKIKRQASNVIHGLIYEVSLVLSGANPGAKIEMNMTHSDDGKDIESDSGTIYTGQLLHAADDIPDEEVKDKGDDKMDDEKTIGDIIETLNEEQMEAVYALLGSAVDGLLGSAVEGLEGDEEIEQSYDLEGDDTMKHNVFNGNEAEGEILTQSDVAQIFTDAQELGSLQDSLLQHGITNIEKLFPEAHNVTQSPTFIRDTNTKYQEIIAAVTKSPFSRIKTMFADLTEDQARARGYIKGKKKLEQIFDILDRETTPQTVYKLQKLDRDDIIDITDFDVVAWMNKEMRFMLEEELARAILVGDGRQSSDSDKIKENKIRPIIKDTAEDGFYTMVIEYTDPNDFIQAVIKGMVHYQGSGSPTLYMDPVLLADLRLLKKEDGGFLFGDIPSKEAIAARLGVKAIEDTTLMTGKGALLVNLADYHVGSTKGGEVTTFDDFDIDYNKYTYLIETRLSGALVKPKSAIHFKEEVAGGGVED